MLLGGSFEDEVMHAVWQEEATDASLDLENVASDGEGRV